MQQSRLLSHCLFHNTALSALVEHIRARFALVHFPQGCDIGAEESLLNDLHPQRHMAQLF